MDALPFFANLGEVLRQPLNDPTHLLPRPTIVFEQLGRSFGAVKVKHHLVPSADDVHVCRPMVVRIDHDPQPVQAQNRGQHKLSAWVLQGRLQCTLYLTSSTPAPPWHTAASAPPPPPWALPGRRGR